MADCTEFLTWLNINKVIRVTRYLLLIILTGVVSGVWAQKITVSKKALEVEAWTDRMDDIVLIDNTPLFSLVANGKVYFSDTPGFKFQDTSASWKLNNLLQFKLRRDTATTRGSK